MAIRDTGAVKEKAAACLGQAQYSPKKLNLLYAGAALGVSLVITLLDLALLQGIGSTGGLSGMGMRSVLETVRTVLQYALRIALPFWEFGFLFAAIRMARNEDNRPATLLEGFRRLGPVLRLYLIEGFLYGGVAMVCIYIGSFLFAMSPLAAPLMELVEPLMTESITIEQLQEAISHIPPEILMAAVWPMLVISGVLCLGVLTPMFYRLRLAGFLVMDRPGTGALMAMLISHRLMHRNCFKWFRLDVSFWWYYGILALSAVVGYADVILAAVGISLPFSGGGAWLLFYALGVLVQFLLGWQAQSRVQTAYAVAYDILLEQGSVPPPEKPAPKDLPWDDYTQQ